MKPNGLTLFILSVLLFCMTSLAIAASKKDLQENILYPRVKFETSLGDFTVELDRRKAPLTVNRFLTLVVEGEYEGTIFHRLIPGFVAQAGGYDKNYEGLPVHEPIHNESGNGLKNSYGSLAMARMNDPHSATRQFYFNLGDNKHLDPGKNWGYTVFGEIEENFEVLEKLEELPTDFNKELNQPNVPVQQVVIKRITLLPPL
ncbi:peptidylprolyl isomerase [Catenovulum sp. SM1970]|uniref:peptidylprolyl isomerase n=1 Tax=Marinifaba aquimaris TaxID=2741323 RepID=UPI001571619A|nr:peptidylprolyl isomerase [Marinifaba aquimaris]NTS77594.1 peptidylprolyl isomerase [Marinifaba aquimaris]